MEHGPESHLPPETASDEDAGGAQIMNKLPRARPQRRSERRSAPAGGKPRAQAKRGEAPAPQEPSTPRTRAVDRAQTASRRRAASAAAAPSRAAERAQTVASRGRKPGMPELAAQAAFEAAKLPLKLGAATARGTARLVRRGLRIR